MAETHQEVVKVWIAPGCIVCDACETDCPEVFDVTEETCLIRPEAQKPEFTKPLTPSIIVAAEGCPVDVIKFETVEVEGPEPWAGQEEEAAAAAPAGGGGAAKAKAADPIPEGPPDPKWAGLLEHSHTSGSRSAGGATVTVRPSAKATAEIVGKAMPKDSPPDAMAAAAVGTGFVRPRPTVKERIRERSDARAAAKASDRRGFIAMLVAVGTSGWTYLAATGAVAGGAFQAFLVPRLIKEPPSQFRAGKLSDYPDDGVYENFKGTQQVWIVRRKGKLFALSTICTHLGCIPNWLTNDAKFKCPCHGSGFYMDGVNFEGPAPRPLERHRIYLEGDTVMVDKSQKYRQELNQWGLPGSEILV